ncbi:hypothetical protein MBRA1_001626 [Malassezia brasiliensis]|uniref:Meiotically up-regulated protein Msb1/Mug8 domain-containing protein n=1 Tax=Malassezia brasiliensis TaxID=1821822 RepID=A0AAF0DT69_9BASI|nr:hypothetical protein MBRA1_001626 [Malassezia brasiliensis]
MAWIHAHQDKSTDSASVEAPARVSVDQERPLPRLPKGASQDALAQQSRAAQPPEVPVSAPPAMFNVVQATPGTSAGAPEAPREPVSQAGRSVQVLEVPQVEPVTLYGYTGLAWEHPMDVEEAYPVVVRILEQIRARGIDAPLLLSSMALDLSASASTKLVRALLATYSTTEEADANAAQVFAEELRFANVYNLVALLKWVLARVGCVVAVRSATEDGVGARADLVLHQEHGFVPWTAYAAWRERERREAYPTTAYLSLTQSLEPPVVRLLDTLLDFFALVATHSRHNGMTPSKIARIFGPLLFGLPEDAPFDETYAQYVRAGNATEHILLAFMRYHASMARSPEMLPRRLLKHIRDYPRLLAPEVDKSSAYVRTIAATPVTRNVREYARDLVHDVVQWPSAALVSALDGGVSDAPIDLAERSRKLLNIGATRRTPRRGARVSGDAFSTLASQRWTEFADEGFNELDNTRLSFDLREQERRPRMNRVESMHWYQFEELGFQGPDADEGRLDWVLRFDEELQDEAKRAPHVVEMQGQTLPRNNSHILHGEAVAFPYDTRSVAGAPIAIDEMFPEVWADYLIGNGWSNRDEGVHRNANFAVLQICRAPGVNAEDSLANVSLSLPSAADETGTVSSAQTPSSAGAWFIVQETVPESYRATLDQGGRTFRHSLPMLRKLNQFRMVRAGLAPSSTVAVVHRAPQEMPQASAPSAAAPQQTAPSVQPPTSVPPAPTNAPSTDGATRAVPPSPLAPPLTAATLRPASRASTTPSTVPGPQRAPSSASTKVSAVPQRAPSSASTKVSAVPQRAPSSASTKVSAVPQRAPSSASTQAPTSHVSVAREALETTRTSPWAPSEPLPTMRHSMDPQPVSRLSTDAQPFVRHSMDVRRDAWPAPAAEASRPIATEAPAPSAEYGAMYGRPSVEMGASAYGQPSAEYGEQVADAVPASDAMPAAQVAPTRQDTTSFQTAPGQASAQAAPTKPMASTSPTAPTVSQAQRSQSPVAESARGATQRRVIGLWEAEPEPSRVQTQPAMEAGLPDPSRYKEHLPDSQGAQPSTSRPGSRMRQVVGSLGGATRKTSGPQEEASREPRAKDSKRSLRNMFAAPFNAPRRPSSPDARSRPWSPLLQAMPTTFGRTDREPSGGAASASGRSSAATTPRMRDASGSAQTHASSRKSPALASSRKSPALASRANSGRATPAESTGDTKTGKRLLGGLRNRGSSWLLKGKQSMRGLRTPPAPSAPEDDDDEMDLLPPPPKQQGSRVTLVGRTGSFGAQTPEFGSGATPPMTETGEMMPRHALPRAAGAASAVDATYGEPHASEVGDAGLERPVSAAGSPGEVRPMSAAGERPASAMGFDSAPRPASALGAVPGAPPAAETPSVRGASPVVGRAASTLSTAPNQRRGSGGPHRVARVPPPRMPGSLPGASSPEVPFDTSRDTSVRASSPPALSSARMGAPSTHEPEESHTTMYSPALSHVSPDPAGRRTTMYVDTRTSPATVDTAHFVGPTPALERPASAQATSPPLDRPQDAAPGAAPTSVPAAGPDVSRASEELESASVLFPAQTSTESADPFSRFDDTRTSIPALPKGAAPLAFMGAPVAQRTVSTSGAAPAVGVSAPRRPDVSAGATRAQDATEAPSRSPDPQAAPSNALSPALSDTTVVPHAPRVSHMPPRSTTPTYTPPPRSTTPTYAPPPRSTTPTYAPPTSAPAASSAPLPRARAAGPAMIRIPSARGSGPAPALSGLSGVSSLALPWSQAATRGPPSSGGRTDAEVPAMIPEESSFDRSRDATAPVPVSAAVTTAQSSEGDVSLYVEAATTSFEAPAPAYDSMLEESTTSVHTSSVEPLHSRLSRNLAAESARRAEPDAFATPMAPTGSFVPNLEDPDEEAFFRAGLALETMPFNAEDSGYAPTSSGYASVTEGDTSASRTEPPAAPAERTVPPAAAAPAAARPPVSAPTSAPAPVATSPTTPFPGTDRPLAGFAPSTSSSSLAQAKSVPTSSSRSSLPSNASRPPSRGNPFMTLPTARSGDLADTTVRPALPGVGNPWQSMRPSDSLRSSLSGTKARGVPKSASQATSVGAAETSPLDVQPQPEGPVHEPKGLAGTTAAASSTPPQRAEPSDDESDTDEIPMPTSTVPKSSSVVRVVNRDTSRSSMHSANASTSSATTDAPQATSGTRTSHKRVPSASVEEVPDEEEVPGRFPA